MAAPKTPSESRKAFRRSPSGVPRPSPSRSRRPTSVHAPAQDHGDLLDRLVWMEVESRVLHSDLNVRSYPKVERLLLDVLVAEVTRATRRFRGRKLDLERGLRKWLLYLDARGLALGFRSLPGDCSGDDARVQLLRAVEENWEKLWPGYAQSGQALRVALGVDSCLGTAVTILLSEEEDDGSEDAQDALSVPSEQNAIDAARRQLHRLGRDPDLESATLDDLRVSGRSAAERLFGALSFGVSSVDASNPGRHAGASVSFLETVRAALEEQFTRSEDAPK